MKWVITLYLCISSSYLFGYTFTNFKPFNPFEFSIQYNYISDTDLTTANAKENLALQPIGIDFTFHTLNMEFTFFPISLRDDSGEEDTVNAFVQNIRWQIYKDLDFKWIRALHAGLQVGAINLGLPESNFEDSSIFSDYMMGYYFMHEFHIGRFNLYTGQNFQPQSDMSSVHIIEYQYHNTKLYGEFAYGQTFVGLSTNLGKLSQLTMALNINKDASYKDKFMPKVYFAYRVSNDIYKKKRQKKYKKPLPIDDATYAALEKGLLTFYDKQYTDSLAYYTAVLEKYPYFGLAHLRIANVYFKLKNYYLAEKHWKLALDYNAPNKSEILYYLSTIEERQLEESKLRHKPNEDL